MAIEFFAVFDGAVFRPADEVAILKIKNIERGVPCRLKVSQGRNPLRHRHFFAMMSETLEKWPESRGTCPFSNVESFLDALKYECGYFDSFQTLDGKQLRKPKSIAWEKCDQPEFMERIWNPCVDVMAHIIGITREELVTDTRHL